jgi:cytochrome c oxidase subunit 3
VSATTYDLGSARSNGWWGIVVFVMGETTLFLMLFASYFYLRLQSTHWPPPHVAKPPVLVPTLLTVALVLTSFGMQRAWHAAQELERVRAWWLLAASGAVQAGYLIWQMFLFVDGVHKTPPSHSAYASITYTILAVDHLHVFLGILLTAWMTMRFATRITPYRLRGLQAVTFYWHAVNAITVAVLLVSISPHLHG